MGIADPLLVRHESLSFYDRRSQSGPVRRVLDVHGASLSVYLGKGNKRTSFHNDLYATGAALAHFLGFNARQQPNASRVTSADVLVITGVALFPNAPEVVPVC